MEPAPTAPAAGPPSGDAGVLHDLPLFPLGTVLFPRGVLALKVFEARYLDLISACLREGSPFGVVTLMQGGEVHRPDDSVKFERVGCLAMLQNCDSDQPGILQVRCIGGSRFEPEQIHQCSDGLWLASRASLLADDLTQAPRPPCHGAVLALGRAVAALDQRGQHPFQAPFCYDDAGWVANRWCEILPIPLATRHKLMALPDPHARLQLVNDFLCRHGIVDA
jgi:uncharacterized protein